MELYGKWIFILLAGFELILIVDSHCSSDYDYYYTVICYGDVNLDYYVDSDVRYLYIDNAVDINILPRTFFNDYYQIKVLHMISSNIEDIEATTFDHLLNLRSINLEQNNLSHIKQGIFDKLRELKDINLANNRINSIDTEAFKDTSLQTVNLTGNCISVFGLWPRNLNQLITLDMSYNKLSHIGNLSFGLDNVSGNFTPQLQELNLAHNHIKSIDKKTFLTNSQLKSVNLTANSMSVLGDWWMYLDHLKIMDISYNILKQILSLPPNLEYLNLKQNHLKSLEGTLPNVIRILDASENSIELIDEEYFSNSGEIQTINLSSNKLSSLPVQFSKKISKLEELDLSKNEFTSFRFGVLAGLQNLQTLDLSQNKLIVIPHDVYILKRLSSLYIQNNKMTKIDLTMLRMNSQLKKININENRWDCHYLLQLLQTKFDFIRGTHFNDSNIMGIKCQDEDQSNSTNLVKPELNVTRQSWENSISDDFKKSAFYKFFNEHFLNTSFVKFHQNFYNRISNESSTQKSRKFEDELIPNIGKLTDVMEQLNRNLQKMMNKENFHFDNTSSQTLHSQLAGQQMRLKSFNVNSASNNNALVFIVIVMVLNIIMTLF